MDAMNPGGKPMLATTKYMYALDMWTVEKRPTVGNSPNPPTTATAITGAARMGASSASR